MPWLDKQQDSQNSRNSNQHEHSGDPASAQVNANGEEDVTSHENPINIAHGHVGCPQIDKDCKDVVQEGGDGREIPAMVESQTLTPDDTHDIADDSLYGEADDIQFEDGGFLQ